MHVMNEQDPLTYEIIGAAIEVHKELGPGLLESLYEEALCIELHERNLEFERQKLLEISYKGHDIGTFVVDIIVENRVVVELKSVRQLAPIHEAQLLSYLHLTKCSIGLLLNFNVAVLKQGVKRMAV